VHCPIVASHSHFLTLISVLALASCSRGVDQGQAASGAGTNEIDELRAFLNTPQYEPIRRISGKAMFGQETSIIGVCESERATCKLPLNIDGFEQPCWLEFTKRASADLERLAGVTYLENGEYWINGAGRIAVRPGLFGHLNKYTCQVEMTSVAEFETGPPHFWEPPPPTG
jgi:hypothetical protein